MKLIESFPRIPLGIFPTPVHKLENISRLLGRNIYIKRDDLTGIGLGGNKVRKLEFLLADAKAQGAEVVFTTGGAQSNHAMLTAAAAGKLGMKAILVLKKRGVTDCVGNQLLEALMGTEVRFVDTDDYADIYAEIQIRAFRLKEHTPFPKRYSACSHIRRKKGYRHRPPRYRIRRDRPFRHIRQDAQIKSLHNRSNRLRSSRHFHFRPFL